MPVLTKSTISSFLRSDCLRRLKLELTPSTKPYQAERAAQNMPPRAVARPGLQALASAGNEWEQAKVNDLVRTFGLQSVRGNYVTQPNGTLQFNSAPLDRLIQQAAPDSFLVQAEYSVGATFQNSLGISGYRTAFNLGYGDLRPDLIQILSPGLALEEVRPDGSVLPVPPNDTRIPLRIIDIKLTAEPSISYLAEVTYYAMTLAGWLTDKGISGFIVVPEAAVWPGSHDASALVQLHEAKRAAGQTATSRELLQALEDDLEIVPFGVFSPRLRRFLQFELKQVLASSWTTLDWHVDNRCLGCDYLGYPWPGTTSDPRHCWPSATSQDHLSRVAFVSRGARGALIQRNITSVAALAGTPSTDPAFDDHQGLRATRTVVAGRAHSLSTNQSSIPPQAGTSAVMPKWADLRIYVTVDFDIGSGISVALGLKGFFWVNQARVQPGQQQTQSWTARVFPVDQRSQVVEQRELLNFLNAINQMLQHARNAALNPTVQIYLWDNVTYEHLVRIIGRHLPAIIGNNQLKHLAWLFPPERLVANPEMSDRKSPLTVVRDVVRAIVAAPVPHYYSLLNVAREYHSPRTQPPWNQFVVPALFEDPLSDHIPSERAHEIWSRATGSRPWNVQLQQLDRTVKTRLSALESVTQRIEEDLRNDLRQTAPRIADLGPPRLPARMSHDGRLWYVFAKLNAALNELEVQQVRAMPPHEREARYRSAHLVKRLSPRSSATHLTRLNLAASPNRWVYELAPGSREVKVREGDFNYALAPLNAPGFLDRTLAQVTNNAQLPLPGNASAYCRMERVSNVTVAGIDRDNGIIVLDMNAWWAATVQAAEAAGLFSFRRDVMLDPVNKEFLLDRLERTLNAIGNPPIARPLPAVAQALGGARAPRAGTPSPCADVLWDGQRLSQMPSGRTLGGVRAALTRGGLSLNSSQWQAWGEALSRRLHLIWGPPGTGKSRTLRAVVLGAIHAAARAGTSLRVLVAGPTYESIDNVLITTVEALTQGPLALPQVTCARLRSSSRSLASSIPLTLDYPSGSTQHRQLIRRLGQQQGLFLIGSTAQQAHKLLDDAGSPVSRFFDLVVIDEASQLDVASATLALAGLADDGSVVVAGDPKQLPPIHAAQEPLGLEPYVGPVFTYLQTRHQLSPSILNTNYRSNETIVRLSEAAGYPPGVLQSHSPTLTLDLLSALPAGPAAPAAWPGHLFWTPEWSTLLNPTEPCSVFVYDEGRSSQWNPFEADAVASIIWLLSGRLSSQLANERDASGSLMPRSTNPYPIPEFWNKGIGVVTPHRAQQALVVTGLQRIFGGAVPPATIRAAVDTVERFQGQQRDVMIATFALGDADAIADEDEFLLSLNRFNVMASRARAKLIVFVSRQVVDHLSSDPQVLRGSALLKTFVETFCSQSRSVTLGSIGASGPRTIDGEFRWHP